MHIIKEEESVLIPILHKLKHEHKQPMLMREVMLSRYLDILLVVLTRIFRPIEGRAGYQGKETNPSAKPGAAPLYALQGTSAKPFMLNVCM
ncbi:hypothetical protein [Pontibacter virosus]|uniref:Uncharacterized protein n=1 Tax=Pontibacter virosus TaxID=1765052 RepID=A0A2U1APG9_9BACT|nr:hypothetical protein [Pontibacter virosus]PVY38323.1 hypothetical protein C8E01_11723 [Pontibacter virosus]